MIQSDTEPAAPVKLRKVQFGGFPPGPASINMALPFIISYDRYEDLKKGRRYHLDGSVSLPDYQRQAPFSIQPLPVRVVSDTSKPKHFRMDDLPGELGRRSYLVASDSGRRFTKSMMDNMEMLERLGECLEPFTIDNIRVRNGLCVFYNVRRIPLDYKKLEGNYKTCRKILDTRFKVNNNVPEDIQHLLDMMDSSFKYRSLFRSHASLWPLSDRAGKYMQMHDKLMSLNGNDRNNIYETMGKEPYLANWRVAANSNELKKIYSHPTVDYSPLNDGDDQLKNLSEEIKTRKKNRDEGAKFTKYLRNRSYHRMDNYHAGRYSAQGSEVTALVRWAKAYAVLQFELFKVSVQANKADLDRGRLY